MGTYTPSGPDAAGARIWLTGDDEGDFDIDGGELTFRSPPDFENPTDADGDNEYSVTVNANDGTNDASTDVTVTVTDVDELGDPNRESQYLLYGETHGCRRDLYGVGPRR